MHTMARVKNLHLAEGDTPEPAGREIGEVQVVEAADRLIANTLGERHELIDLYAAEPEKVVVVPPGVDLSLVSPGDVRAARAAVGLPQDAKVLLFVGRIQPLKAPEVLVKAAAELLGRHPSWAGELVVVVLGGPSGSGLAHPRGLQELAEGLGINAQVRFVQPVPRRELADWYRAADLVTVPSHSESFGLVAVEAQACGTPVVAADVGGLPTAVGEAGVLVAGHDPHVWSLALESLLLDPEQREKLSRRAVEHAALFGWDRTTERLYEVYVEACRARAHSKDAPSPNGSLAAGVPASVTP
jgi:D-inositol-3-phosphate glycosyltransferase